MMVGVISAPVGTDLATLLTGLCLPAGLRLYPWFQNPLSWPCPVHTYFFPPPLLVKASVALPADPRDILHSDSGATFPVLPHSCPLNQRQNPSPVCSPRPTIQEERSPRYPPQNLKQAG